jgi:hypothetical protein
MPEHGGHHGLSDCILSHICCAADARSERQLLEVKAASILGAMFAPALVASIISIWIRGGFEELTWNSVFADWDWLTILEWVGSLGAIVAAYSLLDLLPVIDRARRCRKQASSEALKRRNGGIDRALGGTGDIRIDAPVENSGPNFIGGALD